MPQFKAMPQAQIDLHFMGLALNQAKLAESEGEVPVGALIALNNEVISDSYNQKEMGPCATYHAEILAIEKASKLLNSWRLSDCTLYVTLEPCVMCAGALVASRIKRLVYGTKDPKAGAVGSILDLSANEKLNHKFEVTNNVLQPECSKILKNFFANRRK